VIQSFHRLRRHEEGQTLILAALFGLILALMVLGTVNIGRAIYDKMAVQTACDNGAYSQAAVEARVLNYTAYTNRAMVVHYAAVMAATSYLTWIHFSYAFIHGLLSLLRWIPVPPLQAVVNGIDQILRWVITVIDGAVALLVPTISAANMILWALQEGAWLALTATRLTRIPPEAHSGDAGPDYFEEIWPNAIPAANVTVFSQTRGHALLPVSTAESARILLNDRSDVVQMARMHMVEIANSARVPWVAYGDRYDQSPVPTLSPIARHWRWGFDIVGCGIGMGIVARTELGSFKPGTYMGYSRAGGQIYSGQVAQGDAHCLGGSLRITFFGLSALDDMFHNTSMNFIGVSTSGSGIIARAIARLLAATLFASFNGLKTWAQSNANVNPRSLDKRIFALSPYVYFAPNAAAKPHGGLGAIRSGLGNFGQPDVIFGLARQGLGFNREPGATTFAKNFRVDWGAGRIGSTDFQYNSGDWPTRLPGGTGNISLLHKGFNTFCAAQAYYHRPGEWREMPNFFNPLWGARLMPIVDSNAAAALGLNLVPFVRSYVLH
jgi:hypothetical protein